MPNWCSSKMVVLGNPTELKKFRNKLLEAMKRSETNNHWHLYEIYEVFGYTEELILKDKNDTLGYNRGYIEDVGDIHNGRLDVYYESAWSPMIDGFDYLLSHHYTTLRQVTLSEEPGEELFINTDRSHKILPERFYLYVEDYDTYYPKSVPELCNIINQYNDNDKKVTTLNECFNLIKKHKNYIGSNQVYMCLNEFCCC